MPDEKKANVTRRIQDNISEPDTMWEYGYEYISVAGLQHKLTPVTQNEFDTLSEKYNYIAPSLRIVQNELQINHEILELVIKNRRGEIITKNHILLLCRDKGNPGSYKWIILNTIDSALIPTIQSVGVFVACAQKILLEMLGINDKVGYDIYHVVNGRATAQTRANRLTTSLFFFRKRLEYATQVIFPGQIFTFLESPNDLDDLNTDQEVMVNSIERAERREVDRRKLSMINLTIDQLAAVLSGNLPES